MTNSDKEKLISILSSFETRSNTDIQFLMEQAFKAGHSKRFLSFDMWFKYIKVEVLGL